MKTTNYLLQSVYSDGCSRRKNRHYWRSDLKTKTNRAMLEVPIAAYSIGFEFKDGTKQANEYAYDANGNLTKDLNKNISSIQYNCLNLPQVVTFSDGSTITYTYAADGTKLRVVHKIGSTTTTTDYCGNVVYENGTPKYLLTEEGYVTLADKKYHYFLKDHQGNNRVVVDAAGTVEEVNHYYPFGGTFASTSVQPYKYNGKEYDDKKGLNWYDYGARHYDAAIGRFTTVDPMAENAYSGSPYAYCLNNPVKLVDPTGCFASTHTDSLGNVVDVFNDGDLGVYRHNTDWAGTEAELTELYSTTNTAAGGEKMGETYEWNSFLENGNSSPKGRIDFESKKAGEEVFNKMYSLIKSGLGIRSIGLIIYASNASNGEYFDIKSSYGPYYGSQFGANKYVSMRDAGNILAGMAAKWGGLSAIQTYSLFGAFQLSKNNRSKMPLYIFKALKLGPKGSYGETPISHIFQKRGYEFNFNMK